MARGDRGGSGNRDTDARPGGSGESPQYSRVYDARSESEFSNKLETSAQIRGIALQEQFAAQQEEAREAALAAQSRVHVFPNVGKFIIPAENTWAAHAELIKDKDQNLYFNPKKFVYFDKIIAEKLKNPALTDPKHRDYARYEGLRNNIAVLRNDIIGMYLNDGSFDPGDEVHVPQIQGIATAIADGLNGDKWYKRPFVASLSMDVANIEGVGAREIYNYLLANQTSPAGRLEGMRQRFNTMFGANNRSWGLLPLEKTPFSAAGLAAPPPMRKVCYTPEELAAACANDNDKMVTLSENTIGTAHTLSSLDTLAPPARETSIEEARTILRYLRNLQFTDMDMEEWMGTGTPAEQAAKAEAISRLVEIYAGQLHLAARKDPTIIHDLPVSDGSEATGTMAQGLALFTLNMLPDGHEGINRLDMLLDAAPASWQQRETQSVSRLLDTYETGLARLARAQLHDQSPADRLIEMSERIRKTATRLRAAKDMEAPAREESIELAREILRKLKNLKFSDKPVEELIDSGTPEDKAAFVQKIDEMVETYNNLLAEAAALNPNLLNDPRIKEANDAVGTFAHTVSLMAAKEIPNSIAAAQQISADVTQMPEEWKDMHDRTVGRLVKSMEGGLESAVNDLAQQQQEEQQQDEEMAQDAIDSALAHSDQSRRRRRRRRQRAGQSAGRQRKVDREIKADDFALQQGRFRDHTPDDRVTNRSTPAVRPMPALRPEDLEAIRALGGNLRDINNQAATLTLPVTDVAVAENPMPDDRTFLQRERDQKTGPNNQRPSSRDRV